MCQHLQHTAVQAAQEVEAWQADNVRHLMSYEWLMQFCEQPKRLSVELKSSEEEKSSELMHLLKALVDSSWEGEMELQLWNSHREAEDCSATMLQLKGAK